MFGIIDASKATLLFYVYPTSTSRRLATATGPVAMDCTLHVWLWLPMSQCYMANIL